MGLRRAEPSKKMFGRDAGIGMPLSNIASMRSGALLLAMMFQPSPGMACDLGMAFERWPDMQDLTEPVSFKAPSGHTLHIKRFVAEQIIGQKTCIVKIRIDDDPARVQPGDDRTEEDWRNIRSKAPSVSKIWERERRAEAVVRKDQAYAKEYALQIIKTACDVNRAVVIGAIGPRSLWSSAQLYAEPDGNLKERPIQLCAP